MLNDFYIGSFVKTVKKKWGTEYWIYNAPEYCGKILEFNAGASFSMHFHREKMETWHCLSGSFLLSVIDTDTASQKDIGIKAGQCIHIPRCLPHKLTNTSDGVSTILEVSTQHFDSDSYRIAKGDSQI